MLEENIRAMRREKGLTQEQLAEVMGVSTASVSKWETGMAAPELSMLAALADYFEMSIDALIGHTIDKAQLSAKVAAVKELSLAGEDDAAIEQAEGLLRRYPNEYSVVECAAGVYYAAFIHEKSEKKMRRSMELKHRKYELSKDKSGKAWFELYADLANCHELLEENEKAKEYYEESNVAGMNDSAIARCLARMGETDEAISGMSKAIESNVFVMLTDLMQLAALWEEKGDSEKVKATYRFTISMMENCNSGLDLKVMKMACHFSLACVEKEDGNVDVAREHIRKAVCAEIGRDLQNADSEGGFLQAENSHQVIHTAFDGNSQIALWLMATGDEELLAVAQEELERQ